MERTLLQRRTRLAHYERAVGRVSALDGSRHDGLRHFLRSERVFSGLHHVPGLLEVTQLRHQSEDDAGSEASPLSPSRPSSWNLQEIASLMLHAGRPELLATGIVAILSTTRCVVAAVARARSDDGTADTLSSFGTLKESSENQTLTLGASANRTIEVVLQPLPDIESHATLNALGTLLGTVRELEIARRSGGSIDALAGGRLPFEGQGAAATAPWPSDGDGPPGRPYQCPGADYRGKRHRQGSARPIDSPWVPSRRQAVRAVQLRAVPRELLESQLFGHRRGSFTGADRDSPVVIRAAKDGTVFLDEIGELGLDLIPSCSGSSSRGKSARLGDSTPRKWTSGSLPRPTPTSTIWCSRAGFARTSSTASACSGCRFRRCASAATKFRPWPVISSPAPQPSSEGTDADCREAMEHCCLFDWPGNVRQLRTKSSVWWPSLTPTRCSGRRRSHHTFSAPRRKAPRRRTLNRWRCRCTTSCRRPFPASSAK